MSVVGMGTTSNRIRWPMSINTAPNRTSTWLECSLAMLLDQDIQKAYAAIDRAIIFLFFGEFDTVCVLEEFFFEFVEGFAFERGICSDGVPIESAYKLWDESHLFNHITESGSQLLAYMCTEARSGDELTA